MKTLPQRWLVLPAVILTSALASCDRQAPDSAPSNAADAATAPAPTGNSADVRFAAAHPVDRAFQSKDGVYIYYTDDGSAEQALVLVHGWNCDREYWQLQREFLAERFRVISLDLAGHGASGAERVDWSIDAFAEDVAAVVTGLALTDVTLVGHSMGGNVVVAAAEKLGDRLNRVVVVDSLRDPSLTIAPAQLSATLDNMDADYAGTVTSIVQTMFVDASTPQVRDFVIRDMAASPAAVGRASLLALAGHNAVPQLEALQAPLVQINSDYQPTNQSLLQELVADYRYLEMSDVGHFVMLEDPVTFTNLLLSALEPQQP